MEANPPQEENQEMTPGKLYLVPTLTKICNIEQQKALEESEALARQLQEQEDSQMAQE